MTCSRKEARRIVIQDVYNCCLPATPLPPTQRETLAACKGMFARSLRAWHEGASGEDWGSDLPVSHDVEGPLEASGGVWEAFGRRVWGFWGHLGRFGAQEALKNSQGRPQISPKATPRGPRWPPRASQTRPHRPQRSPKRPLKHHKNNITSRNRKNFKNDDSLMKINDF